MAHWAGHWSVDLRLRTHIKSLNKYISVCLAPTRAGGASGSPFTFVLQQECKKGQENLLNIDDGSVCSLGNIYRKFVSVQPRQSCQVHLNQGCRKKCKSSSLSLPRSDVVSEMKTIILKYCLLMINSLIPVVCISVQEKEGQGLDLSQGLVVTLLVPSGTKQTGPGESQ